ncbi:12616_t:CDS:2 [Ambispora gerdemannii]|uniref:12616_t:CDS:1 n=1 Tax=Ambispora gerdemannii TaxID=144530 RepID=A0A9N8VPJ8_9GLOM|nr:12616_t:CDS:2 [Ambispora gerdemannii]
MISIKSFATLFVILAVMANYAFATPQTMLDLVNAERKKAGVGALVLDDRLNSAAQKHSDYQAKIKQMTHDDAAGDLGTRITKEGFSWSACGENVAWNQKSEQDVMNAWMHSSGHKANILSSTFTHFGYGVNSRYYTQDFGTLMVNSHATKVTTKNSVTTAPPSKNTTTAEAPPSKNTITETDPTTTNDTTDKPTNKPHNKPHNKSHKKNKRKGRKGKKSKPQ